MPQRIFKIYDGRTGFWQWDTKQKLIVLDKSITAVHFSNKDINYSITEQVYEKGGQRLCDVPDVILQFPKNIIAYAYTDGATVKSVRFAVTKRSMPGGHIVVNNASDVIKINQKLDMLESMIKDIEIGELQINKFNNIQEASNWAKENKNPGTVIVVRVDSKWIAHVVEDDYSVTPVCNYNGEMEEVNIPAPKLAAVTMLASGWNGTSSPYSQIVVCNDASANSKLDLQPTPAQIAELQDSEISLMAANTDGVVTIYAIGGRPTVDMTMDVLITEVTIA